MTFSYFFRRCEYIALAKKMKSDFGLKLYTKEVFMYANIKARNSNSVSLSLTSEGDLVRTSLRLTLLHHASQI